MSETEPRSRALLVSDDPAQRELIAAELHRGGLAGEVDAAAQLDAVRALRGCSRAPIPT
jgi:CheY-like chemotaxis protein